MKEPSSVPSPNRIFSFSGVASALIIGILGFLSYADAICHPFVHDDVVFIQQNPFIGRWDNIGDAFLNPSIPQSFQGLVTPYYRPVLEVFYRLQYLLFGFDPRGFHLFNIIIHVASGLFVFGLLLKLLKDRDAAFLVAILFVVHPVQTQAVACVAGISNVLCGFFLLASLYFYVHSSTCSQHRQKLGWFAASLVLFITALFTKEQAIFGLAVFAAYEIFLNERGKEPLVTGVYRLAVLAVAAFGYLFCRQILFGSVTSAVFENMAEFKLRLLTVPRIIETFIGILFFPFGLHYYRSADILAPHAVPLIILGVLTVMTVMIVGQLPLAERKKAWFGLVWFLVLLFPVLNIVPLVNEYSFVAASEHGLYLPLVGFFIFFVTAVFYGFKTAIARHSAKVRIGLFILMAVLCAMTFRQNTYWRGEIPLFERALVFEPQLGRVHVLLAKAYLFNGRIDDALVEFASAETIMTAYAQKAVTPKARGFYEGFLKGIYSDSAQGHLAKGDFKGAVENYVRALALDPRDSALYINRALVFLQTGRLSDGIKDLETALRLDPDNLSAANNLGIAYIQSGEPERGRRLFQWILGRDPGFAAARDNLRKLEETPR